MPNVVYQPGAKFILGGDIVFDLTGDDVQESDVAAGKRFHKKDGSSAVGTSTFDADTGDADAIAAEILSGKTAYVNGSKITGAMPNRASQTGGIADKDTPITIQQGYHDGGGAIGIDATEKAKLIPGNIRQGTTILGVAGSMSGAEDMVSAAATVTPTLAQQVIQPSDLPPVGGKTVNAISEVTVAAIPVTITQNADGGLVYAIG